MPLAGLSILVEDDDIAPGIAVLIGDQVGQLGMFGEVGEATELHSCRRSRGWGRRSHFRSRTVWTIILRVNGRGAYEASRASALAGVPESTLYLWARQGLICPSVSPERVKLWSWSDLVAARAVYWLRHPREGEPRRPTTMPRVKRLLDYLAHVTDRELIGEALWGGGVSLYVDGLGTPHVRQGEKLAEGAHDYLQAEHPDLGVDLLAEFHGQAGAVGPDLRQPARYIRIIPGILSGEPHIEGTRIDTRSVGALRQRGFSVEQITELYPEISIAQVTSAVTLEKRLSANERRLAA